MLMLHLRVFDMRSSTSMLGTLAVSSAGRRTAEDSSRKIDVCGASYKAKVVVVHNSLRHKPKVHCHLRDALAHSQ
jgi:hypothetical protein